MVPSSALYTKSCQVLKFWQNFIRRWCGVQSHKLVVNRFFSFPIRIRPVFSDEPVNVSPTLVFTGFMVEKFNYVNFD